MNIDETLKWASGLLTESCERPRFEAELLLAYHLEKDRIYLHAFDTSEVPDIKRYESLIERLSHMNPMNI